MTPGVAVEARTPAAAMPDTPSPRLAVVAPDALRCAHCGRPLPAATDGRGRRPRFCSPAHREAARLRRERGLPESYPLQPNRHGRRRLEAAAAPNRHAPRPGRAS
jgi:hypothetical protein